MWTEWFGLVTWYGGKLQFGSDCIPSFINYWLLFQAEGWSVVIGIWLESKVQLSTTSAPLCVGISQSLLYFWETRISNEQWESNSFVTVSMTCWHHIKQSMTSINLIGLFGAVQWLVGSSRIFMEINQIALFNFHKIHIFNARLKWVKSLKCWFVCACGVVARK